MQVTIFYMETYGLIGKNIDYSFSRNYFSEKFKSESILNSQYVNFDIDNIINIQELFKQKNRGYNVTIPYKETIIPYLDELDSHAREIGAVNTIKITNGRTKGFNTDWIGFKQSLSPLLKPYHNKALILGTGGASKAVRYTLEQLNIDFATVSRNPVSLGYEDLSEQLLNEFLLIVNCTPVGTFPNTDEAPEIPYEFITDRHLAFDLIYNPQETMFLKKCRLRGAQIKNGLEMLEIQAEEAWKIWNS